MKILIILKNILNIYEKLSQSIIIIYFKFNIILNNNNLLFSTFITGT